MSMTSIIKFMDTAGITNIQLVYYDSPEASGCYMLQYTALAIDRYALWCCLTLFPRFPLFMREPDLLFHSC